MRRKSQEVEIEVLWVTLTQKANTSGKSDGETLVSG
jgi:hypothetical protein